MVMLLTTGSRIDRAYRASSFSAGNLLIEEKICVAKFFFRDDLEIFFFDVCFVINYFSFAIVGIPNFFGQFEYHGCWYVPVIAVYTHAHANLGVLVHFPDHSKDPETLLVFIVGSTEERLHSRVTMQVDQRLDAKWVAFVHGKYTGRATDLQGSIQIPCLSITIEVEPEQDFVWQVFL